MLTFGVEEEFLLLDPGGAVAPVADDVVRLAGPDSGLVPEYRPYQVETNTAVCTRLDELRGELVRLRRLAASSAERAGALLAASGAPPLPGGAMYAITGGDRYRELARRYPDATTTVGTCACHVHVGVPDRDLAAEVLGRLRPWLPALLALSVNSPFTAGADSGWSSTRYRAQLRWPTFRPPGAWRNASGYDLAVNEMIASGAALDPAGVSFLARLSARYPTIEVRIADACLDVEDAVLLAGVVRALVSSLLEDSMLRLRPVSVAQPRLDARLVAAARHGIGPSNLVSRLLAKITPALTASGDLDEIRGLLTRLHRDGTGAQRQRAWWARSAGPRAFVAALAGATVPVPSVG